MTANMNYTAKGITVKWVRNKQEVAAVEGASSTPVQVKTGNVISSYHSTEI